MECIICGKEFIPTKHNGGRKQIVCSKECRLERIKMLNRMSYEKYKEQKNYQARQYKRIKRIQASIKKDNEMSLTEVQQQAREHGMSYGQWVAYNQMK